MDTSPVSFKHRLEVHMNMIKLGTAAILFGSPS